MVKNIIYTYYVVECLNWEFFIFFAPNTVSKQKKADISSQILYVPEVALLTVMFIIDKHYTSWFQLQYKV